MEYKKALTKAQQICSQQEKCRRDISQKLKTWDVPEEDREKIIDALVKDKFIDESRYASSFVNDKITFNKWGRIKIRFQLLQKGLKETIIDEALNEIPKDKYRETVEQVLAQKAKSIKDTDSHVRYRKLMSFAYNRGFSFEECEGFVKGLVRE